MKKSWSGLRSIPGRVGSLLPDLLTALLYAWVQMHRETLVACQQIHWENVVFILLLRTHGKCGCTCAIQKKMEHKRVADRNGKTPKARERTGGDSQKCLQSFCSGLWWTMWWSACGELTMKASFKPPLSAMFSPSVFTPFNWNPEKSAVNYSINALQNKIVLGTNLRCPRWCCAYFPQFVKC